VDYDGMLEALNQERVCVQRVIQALERANQAAGVLETEEELASLASKRLKQRAPMIEALQEELALLNRAFESIQKLAARR
jgi:hypothetical protein